ncbi:pseudouridine synthase [Hymenobacter weizhouensis]|uniref:pseudouridine synthase n=1 Tax=Hymenobacter sp. YIM 151500-1 TaxID=2987689 RepID=UPI002226968C|nr:pseudouridine synthase [Hymenobacter sp. YIM 151500-1]UYZ62221.1 pseudouridine synthase [Hymenobacter sp. YIM 151500-1]
MGKKHFSDENSGRRDRNPNRTNKPGAGGEGFRKFMGPDRGRDERSGGAPRFGGPDAPRGRAGERPAFGRSSGSGFGAPKKFGGSDFSGPRKPGAAGSGYGRGGEGRFNDTDSRRSFGRGEERDERPARPYAPQKTWSGQPYRTEGKSAVPRGLPGERNRKFVKQNPNERDDARPGGFRPAGGGPGQAPRFDSAGREIRPARPFDYRSRPDGLGEERPTGNRENSRRDDDRRGDARRDEGRRGSDFGSDKRDFEPRKPAGGFQRREGGFGGGSFGERPTARPSRFGNDRDARDPRGGAGRREERPFAERPDRPVNKRTGRDLDSNQAGKRKYGEVAGEAPDYKNLRHYEEDRSRGNKRRRTESDAETDETRLNRYIANAGICSRREADALIAAGEIKVNGQVVTEMGYKVQPGDTVQYGKTNLNREKLVYVLLNKPKDFITTTDDPEGRRTVMDLVAGASKERVFPVGRLDRNTTGLLLFTNDGEVAQKLSHPSHRNKKIYQVELDKPLTEEHLRQIAEGVELEDGKAEVDDVAVVAGNPHFVGIELHIGRNRIVRRIFEHLGYDVVSLDRVQYAGLTKKDLPRGKWRFLNEKEVIRLKYFM